MRLEPVRVLVIAVAALWLAGCSTSSKFSDLLGKKDAPEDSAVSALASAPDEAPPPLGVPAAAEPGLLGGNAADDLAKGKQEYRNNNFGMAERYFRRAAESHPNDAEAWLGLAASYDRLRRFDLADRAYGQVIRLTGDTPAVLNNVGYSYMLRGDFARARATLEKARRKDPNNKYVANNLHLLADAQRKGKAVE